MATVKAYLRSVNKKGLAPINVKYTHKSEWFPVPTGIFVRPEDFDKEYGWVRPHHPESIEINQLIKDYKSHLLSTANLFFTNEGIEPTVELVKEKFNEQFLDKKTGNYVFKQTRLEIDSDETYIKTRFADATTNIVLTPKGEELAKKRVVAQLLEGNNINLAPPVTEKPVRKRKLKVTQPERDEFLYLLNKYAEDPTRKANSQKNPKQLRRILLEFSKDKNYPLTFEGMNLDFYHDFGNYLLFDKNYFNNTFGTRIKHLKMFLNHCADDYGIKVNPQYKSKKFRILAEEIEIISLIPAEINLIWYHIPSKAHLEKIKDLMVFGCLTGLRISDIRKSQFNIQDNILYTTTKKTKGQVMLPLELDERILQILEKYDFNLKIISEQKYNEHVKQLCKEVGFTDIIQYSRFKWEKEYQYSAQKWELISSHANRKSAITNWYQAGFPERDILRFIGGKSSRVLNVYIKRDASGLKETVARIKGFIQK